MRQSVLLAVGMTALAVLWLLSGLWVSASGPKDAPVEQSVARPMTVEVAAISAREVMREVVVRGILEPRRRVEVKSETLGLVQSLPVDKGAKVARGDVIAVLAEDDRGAQIVRINAEVASQRLDLEGMRKLRQKGLQAETHLKAKEAQLAAAYAERKRLEVDLARTIIRAPFDGVLETREPEIGTLLEQGDVVAEIVDQSVVKAVGYVPQHSENAIALGQAVEVRLLDGREASGRLTYIAPVAESGTRSFRVEAEIPNAAALFNAGVSVEIRIAVGLEAAHFVSAAILALDDEGRIGVKALAADDTIEFYPIEVMRTTADGIWVTGLPTSLRVVTRGQGFVVTGEIVNPVSGG